MWQALEQVRAQLAADMNDGDDAPREGRSPSEAVDEHAPEAQGDAAAQRGADECDETAAISQRRLSAESLVSPSDPLAYLFSSEPEPEERRGHWDRCDETGELVYYGSDPPDVWPEDAALSAESATVQAAAAPSQGDTPCLADALIMLAERHLSNRQLGEASHDGETRSPRMRRGGERQLLLVHLSEDRLASALGAAGQHCEPSGLELHDAAATERVPFRAEIHGGGWLAGDTLLRLACDCGISVVKTSDACSSCESGPSEAAAAAGTSSVLDVGDVLDVGRSRRTIPPALMRALQVRDGSCQFPGCCHSAWTEAHHIKHWVHGGETSLANTVLLCRFHHMAVHEGGFEVERQGNGSLCFREPNGRVIESAPAPSLSDSLSAGSGAALLAHEQGQRGLAIDRTTSLPNWDGTTPDIGAAVSALWWREERRRATGDAEE